MKGLIISAVVLILLVVGGYFAYTNYLGSPQKIKINSVDITNVYRDCTKNADRNFRDITIQTTVNVDAKTGGRYSERVLSSDCTLKIGPNNIEGFSLNKIPTPNPYVEGIEGSGLYMVTGGELRGDISNTLTFCCQDKCDVANLEICQTSQ